MEKGRILFADNLEAFLEADSEYLELAGYKVLRAPSLSEAERILRQSWVHLAILDIRMIEDKDPEDISGILLAENDEFQSIPKIMLTGYADYQNVRKVLSPKVSGGAPPAVAFVAKQEGPEALLSAVEQAFTQAVRIDGNLFIRWIKPAVCSFPTLTSMLEPDPDDDLRAERTGELEDLFRKFFYGYDQLAIVRLLWADRRGAGLEVRAFTGGNSEQWVVTAGRLQEMQAELDWMSQTDSKTGALSAQTLHYAMAGRIIAKVETAGVKTFEEFFKESSEKAVRAALENLYVTGLGSFPRLHHATGGKSGRRGLDEAYKEWLGYPASWSPEGSLSSLAGLALEARTKQIVEEVLFEEHQMIYRFARQSLSFPNPLFYLKDQGAFSSLAVEYGTAIGNLESGKILVTDETACFPGDLLAPGWGPNHANFLSLETDIRFNLLGVTNLLSLYNFESELLKAKSLLDPIPLSNVEPECRKALAAIQTIRSQAAQVSNERLTPYLTGLFFFTLRGLLEYDAQTRHTKEEIISYLHRLLLAGLLCQVFEQGSGSDQAEQPLEDESGIEIDEKRHEVRVAGRLISLTPREYDLLRYLHQHGDTLCNWEDILAQVFEITKPDQKTDKGLLHTHIDRLRKKIELQPRQPRYLHTIRGEGYMLVVKPE